MTRHRPLRRPGQHLHARSRADDAADAGPAGQAADGNPDRARARRPRRHATMASDADGARSRTASSSSTGRRDSITFIGHTSPPVPSLLRGFSAPVKLQIDLGDGRSSASAAARQRSVQPLAGGADAAPCGCSSRRRRRERDSATRPRRRFAGGAAGLPRRRGRTDPAFAALVAGAAERSPISPGDRPGHRPGRDPRAPGWRCAPESAARHAAQLRRALRRPWHEAGTYSPDAASAGTARAAQRRARPRRRGRSATTASASPPRSSSDATNMTDRLAALARADDHSRRKAREAALGDVRASAMRDEPAGARQVVRPAGDDPRGRHAGPRVKGADAASGLLASAIRTASGRWSAASRWGTRSQFNRADGAGYAFLADIVSQLDALQSAGRGAAFDRVRILADDGTRPTRQAPKRSCAASPESPVFLAMWPTSSGRCLA